jgi:hypothetical protein
MVFLCLISQALCHEDAWGSGGIPPRSLTSALNVGELSALPLGTQRIGGWVNPRVGLDAAEKRNMCFICRKPNDFTELHTMNNLKIIVLINVCCLHQKDLEAKLTWAYEYLRRSSSTL